MYLSRDSHSQSLHNVDSEVEVKSGQRKSQPIHLCRAL